MATIPQEQQDNKISSKISEDINCSVCLDILCKPQTLIPCGHSFCKSCCCFNNCPHCRQPVEGVVPARSLESLIDTLVRVPNLLFDNDDDKEHFLQRMKKEEQTSVAEQVPGGGSNRKRRRQQRDRCTTRNNPYARHGGTAFHPPYNYLNSATMAMTAPAGLSHSRVSPTTMTTGDTAIGGRRRSGATTTATQQTDTNNRGISASDAICID
ncbi:MAG: hypothetical protein ACI8RD_001167 [Bacillariaceae sp.]|jgi:hypothetical protein